MEESLCWITSKESQIFVLVTVDFPTTPSFFHALREGHVYIFTWNRCHITHDKSYDSILTNVTVDSQGQRVSGSHLTLCLVTGCSQDHGLSWGFSGCPVCADNLARFVIIWGVSGVEQMDMARTLCMPIHRHCECVCVGDVRLVSWWRPSEVGVYVGSRCEVRLGWGGPEMIVR